MTACLYILTTFELNVYHLLNGFEELHTVFQYFQTFSLSITLFTVRLLFHISLVLRHYHFDMNKKTCRLMPIFLLLILCRKIMCGVDGGVFQNQSKTYHNRAFCTQSTYHNHASKRCGSLQTRRLAMIGLVFFTDACLGR